MSEIKGCIWHYPCTNASFSTWRVEMSEEGQGVLVFVLLMVVFVIVVIVLSPILAETIDGLFEVTESLGSALP